jgi:glycosyltransferase involved in cell wall biosynthesis
MADLAELASHVAGIIYVSPQHRAAGPCRCVQPIADVPLIVRLLQRVYDGLPGLRALEVVGYTDDSPVGRVVTAAQHTFFASPEANVADALIDWTRHRPKIDVVIVWHELALYPDCAATRELIGVLEERRADVVVAPAYPIGLVPLVLKVSALPALSALFQPTAPLHERPDSFQALYHRLTGPQMSGLDLRIERIGEPDAAHFVRQDLPLTALITDRHGRKAAERLMQHAPMRRGPADANDARDYRRMLERVVEEPPPIAGKPARGIGDARRVLYASRLDCFTGADQCLLALMSGFDRRRYDPVLAVELPGVLAEHAHRASIPVEVADWDSSALTPANLRYWATLLEAYDIDLVHVDSRANTALMTTAFQRGLPMLAHVRTVVAPPFQAVWQCASLVVTPSERIARSVRAAGYDPRKVLHVYDGVDLTRYSSGLPSRSDARRAFGITDSAFVMGMVTRISRKKRQDVAVRALHALRERGVEAVLLLVGDMGSADYIKELTSLGAELGIAEHVRMHAFMPDPRRAYAAADALVVCMGWEGLGQCILEAIAGGVPAIVPRSDTGPAEVIRDGQEGFHYTPYDSNDLAQQAENLSRPDVWTRMSRRARQRSLDFDLAGHVERMTALYEQLLAERPVLV